MERRSFRSRWRTLGAKPRAPKACRTGADSEARSVNHRGPLAFGESPKLPESNPLRRVGGLRPAAAGPVGTMIAQTAGSAPVLCCLVRPRRRRTTHRPRRLFALGLDLGELTRAREPAHDPLGPNGAVRPKGIDPRRWLTSRGGRGRGGARARADRASMGPRLTSRGEFHLATSRIPGSSSASSERHGPMAPPWPCERHRYRRNLLIFKEIRPCEHLQHPPSPPPRSLGVPM